MLADGSFGYDDVVFVPHRKNEVRSVFREIETASGRTLMLTPDHLVMAGMCGEDKTLRSLKRARDVAVGECVIAVSGEDKVVSSKEVEGNGVYSVVTAEGSGYIVVNGIVSSSFAHYHMLPNLYYHFHRAMHKMLPNHYYRYSENDMVVSTNLRIGQFALAVRHVLRMFGLAE